MPNCCSVLDVDPRSADARDTRTRSLASPERGARRKGFSPELTFGTLLSHFRVRVTSGWPFLSDLSIRITPWGTVYKWTKKREGICDKKGLLLTPGVYELDATITIAQDATETLWQQAID